MNRVKKIKEFYNWGGRFINDEFIIQGKKLNAYELQKKPLRHDIINFLLSSLKRDTIYLEIGVRNPDDNYNRIIATQKISVDPGLEFRDNPVDFKVTSDVFFNGLIQGEFLTPNIKFDLVFIDGLHLAEQVDRDIENALKYIKEDGFIVLHDCNPPTEFHARESHHFEISPAGQNWNGTTWKAFLNVRYRKDIFSCCIDTDWGVGIISKNINLGTIPETLNPFYEYSILNNHRVELLNLIDFEVLQAKLNMSYTVK